MKKRFVVLKAETVGKTEVIAKIWYDETEGHPDGDNVHTVLLDPTVDDKSVQDIIEYIKLFREVPEHGFVELGSDDLDDNVHAMNLN